MKLVLATRNRHKLDELRAILHLPGLEVCSALDFPDVPDVVEDGLTFEANAAKKAKALALATRCWALADDSGLEVDALGGAPGIYSARYAGEPSDSSANNRKLLEALQGQAVRTARFRCVLALAAPEGSVRFVQGTCEGKIAETAAGCGGFGYDPLFIPDGYAVSFAEMEPAMKNRISHRARALAAAVREWEGVLRGGGKTEG